VAWVAGGLRQRMHRTLPRSWGLTCPSACCCQLLTVVCLLLRHTFRCTNSKALVFVSDLQGRCLRLGVIKLACQQSRFLGAQMPVGGVVEQDGHGS
jgi:hypothetical protein